MVAMDAPRFLVIGGVLPNVSEHFRQFVNFTGVIASTLSVCLSLSLSLYPHVSIGFVSFTEVNVVHCEQLYLKISQKMILAMQSNQKYSDIM